MSQLKFMSDGASTPCVLFGVKVPCSGKQRGTASGDQK